MKKVPAILKTEEVSTAESGEAEAQPKQPTGDYEVGYCRPPAEHRFRMGNNANPRCRKKNTKNRKVVIREILFAPVTVREGEKVRQVPAIEAVFKRTMAKALGGDHKAALTIIGMAQREGVLTPEQDEALEDLPERDEAILQHALRRFGGSSSGGSDES